MSNGILPRSFYARDTEVVARDLLGALLVCRTAQGTCTGRIVETEAYLGEHDLACHAAAGLTNRTRPLYARPGTAYVYFIYGRYWCVNAVTREEGLPSAVLIRAVEPESGIELIRSRRRVPSDYALTNGPAKLCMALGISGVHNGVSLISGDLTIRRGDEVKDSAVSISPRVGITKCVDWPLRYFVRGNPWVSRTPNGFPVRKYMRRAESGA